MPYPADSRIRARAAMAELLPAECTPTPFFAIDLLGSYLDEYCELVVGPGGHPAGFMTRGEDRVFTEHVRTVLDHLGMPAPALDHHRALASAFEHKRAFLKLEWQPGPTTGVSPATAEPLAACYFRRRPAVDAALRRLREWDIDQTTCAFVAEIARALQKTSIHFTAAAFRPGRPVHHKLYFSQYVTAATRERVRDRIEAVFGLFGMPERVRETWRQNHDPCASAEASTFFVSLSFSTDGLVHSFKLDYPDLSTDQAAAWLPVHERGKVARDTATARRLAGVDRLTFVGVRFTADRPTPGLKYYCDAPA